MNTPEAPPLAESWLEIANGQLFWLKARCTIGRQTENDLVLDSLSVSRRHAQLAAQPRGFTLSDLHSSNGTYVNGAPVTQAVLLQDGDNLQFGDVAVRYRCTRRAEPDAGIATADHTRRMDKVRERACWLLLADVVGFSALGTELGSDVALRKLQAWITGMRPLIEKNSGHINSYVGDAIFAWWPADTDTSAEVLAAIQALAQWRPRSPVGFRVAVHHGTVLFAHSERGEELSGQDVNFTFRAEKIAKKFGSECMLSESAVHALHLDGRCEALGASNLEGIQGRFVFFALPRDLT